MATFATAFISMQRGHKVRRTGWDGYWYFKDGDVWIHTWKGEDLKGRDSSDLIYTLSACACDDWERVIDWKGEQK